MGYFGSYENIERIKEEVWKDKDVKKTVATCFGRHLWSVRETLNGYKYIHLDLVSNMGGALAYKPMDETMRPYYYDCPLSLLEYAEKKENVAEINENAKVWRREVRRLVEGKAIEKEKLKKITYKEKEKVSVYGKIYTILSIEKRGKYIIIDSAGRKYRARKKQLKKISMDKVK